MLQDALPDVLSLPEEATQVRHPSDGPCRLQDVHPSGDGHQESAGCAWDASDGARPGVHPSADVRQVRHPVLADAGVGKLADRELAIQCAGSHPAEQSDAAAVEQEPCTPDAVRSGA